MQDTVEEIQKIMVEVHVLLEAWGLESGTVKYYFSYSPLYQSQRKLILSRSGNDFRPYDIGPDRGDESPNRNRQPHGGYKF